MKIIRKYYLKESNHFYVEYVDNFETFTKKFKAFKNFAKFLDNDLTDANLYEYDFKGVNLRDLDIDNIGISSRILKEYGLLDTTFYYENIDNNSNYLKKTYAIENIVDHNGEAYIKPYDDLRESNEFCISYISDLHLDYKIKKRFKEYASKREIIDYIREIVNELHLDSMHSNSSILLIGGDVSFSYSISRLFFQELRKVFTSQHIFVVLGNHELWDYHLVLEAEHYNSDIINHIVNKHRTFLRELDIHLIQNELLIMKYSKDQFARDEFFILSEKDILDKNDDEFQKIVDRSLLIILGGIGFSGYEPIYNAKFGLYKNAVKTLEEDKILTKRFENIYQKCKQMTYNKKLIVFTHTPKEHWSIDKHVSNWVYVSGHTHQSYFCLDDQKTVFADNQIGYFSTSFGLKHFYLSKDYDVFERYEDGIFEISKNDYIDFHIGHSISMTINRDNINIYMIKKKGLYCFIQENLSNGNFSILSGGSAKKLEKNKDFSYYYENLEHYANAVELFMDGYNRKLKEISSHVKSFGGSGKIHGAIVDIDFYNHLYLNPIDGQITPYFATSISDKYVYKNIISLLYCENKKMYKKYSKMLNDGLSKSSVIELNKGDLNITKKTDYVAETDIYKFSRIAKNLQYIKQIKVIRSWSYQLIESKDVIERAKSLFIDLMK